MYVSIKMRGDSSGQSKYTHSLVTADAALASLSLFLSA